MRFAYPSQKFQDWFTQQWVIFRGRKMDPKNFSWLVGPFGHFKGTNEDFIHQLAERENLIIERDVHGRGLIPNMEKLNLPQTAYSDLSKEVINFYEHTDNYNLTFSVKWNPFFRIFGILINKLFSNRINQLNIPTRNIQNAKAIKSEIITLSEARNKEVKYTFWLRTIQSTGQIVYSGVYSLSTLPSGNTCIKAVFPLPNGNATVLMTPRVGMKGELILDSSGRKFGDAGFYFLLKDSKREYWSQFIPSFRDRLKIGEEDDCLSAEQILTLWHIEVLRFNYKIERKKLVCHHPTANHL